MSRQVTPVQAPAAQRTLRTDGYFITGGSDGDPCFIGHEDDSSVCLDPGTSDREEAHQALREHITARATGSEQ